jgi:hypothetical protein
MCRAIALALSQHPNEHRPECRVPYGVLKEFGKPCSRSGTAIAADLGGALRFGKHQGVKQLGAGSGAESVEAGTELALELIGSHDGRLRRGTVCPRVVATRLN